MNLVKKLESLRVLSMKDGYLFSGEYPICNIKSCDEVRIYCNRQSIEVLNHNDRTIKIVPVLNIPRNIARNVVLSVAEANSAILGI